jgi:hypothetical protein
MQICFYLSHLYPLLKLSKREKCVLRFLVVFRLHARLTVYDAPASIGVSSRLVPTNICNSRLVDTNNYKENFCSFLLKGFPHEPWVPCSTANINPM